MTEEHICDYTLHGQVVHGKQLGRTLGFPTANVAYPAQREHLPNGVYLAEVTLADGRVQPAILNQGKHPTFQEGAPTVEAYLLDFSEDLYGQEITVRYLRFLRSERAFSSAEQLKAQIEADKAQAMAWFMRKAEMGKGFEK